MVLPGAYMTVGLMGDLVPALAERHRVIAVEFQGYGHTADIDRPFPTSSSRTTPPRCSTMWESIGRTCTATAWAGGVAPCNSACGTPASFASSSSRRLRTAARVCTRRCWKPSGTSPRRCSTRRRGATTYDRTAPDPSAFPALVEKLKRLDLSPFDWPIDELAAPALILVGDSDGTRLEHAVEMFRRLGGGVFGDLAPQLPASQLAILPARPTSACSSAPIGSRGWSRRSSLHRTYRPSACATDTVTRPGRSRRAHDEALEDIRRAVARGCSVLASARIVRGLVRHDEPPRAYANRELGG